MAIPELSGDDITAIRRRYIRDLYTAPVANVSPAVMLSHYNRATKSQFIDDDDLQAIAYDVGRAWGEELAGVYSDEFGRQKGGGKSAAEADVAAAALQADAFYRLIRTFVYELMMNDPGFTGSIADEKARAALFSSWLKTITKDRLFTRSRTTAAFRSVPIERY